MSGRWVKISEARNYIVLVSISNIEGRDGTYINKLGQILGVGSLDGFGFGNWCGLHIVIAARRVISSRLVRFAL